MTKRVAVISRIDDTKYAVSELKADNIIAAGVTMALPGIPITVLAAVAYGADPGDPKGYRVTMGCCGRNVDVRDDADGVKIIDHDGGHEKMFAQIIAVAAVRAGMDADLSQILNDEDAKAVLDHVAAL